MFKAILLNHNLLVFPKSSVLKNPGYFCDKQIQRMDTGLYFVEIYFHRPLLPLYFLERCKKT